MSILCTRPASLMGQRQVSLVRLSAREQQQIERTLNDIYPSIHPPVRRMPCHASIVTTNQPPAFTRICIPSYSHSPAPVLPRRPLSPGTRMHAITTRKQAKIQQEATRASSLRWYAWGCKEHHDPPPPRSISQAPKIEHGRHAQGKRWGTGPILASQRSRKTIEAASRAVGWIHR